MVIKSEDVRFFEEIRLSGSGGQGLITAGIILAKSAVYKGIRVTQTQSYGPESRGGASRADVIMSDTEFFYPEATSFDILLCLTQEACDKYAPNLKEDGILIVDSTLVKNISMIDNKVYELPFTNIAHEKLGSILPTNIISLSFLVRKTDIICEKSLKKAIKTTMKARHIDMNLKAMKIGFKLADEYNSED